MHHHALQRLLGFSDIGYLLVCYLNCVLVFSFLYLTDNATKGVQGSECMTGCLLVSPAVGCQKKKMEPSILWVQNADLSMMKDLAM